MRLRRRGFFLLLALGMFSVLLLLSPRFTGGRTVNIGPRSLPNCTISSCRPDPPKTYMSSF